MGQGEVNDKPMTIRGCINKICMFPSAAVKLWFYFHGLFCSPLCDKWYFTVFTHNYLLCTLYMYIVFLEMYYMIKMNVLFMTGKLHSYEMYVKKDNKFALCLFLYLFIYKCMWALYLSTWDSWIVYFGREWCDNVYF